MLTVEFPALDSSARPSGGRPINRWHDEGGALVASAYASGSLRWIDWRGLGIFAFSPPDLRVRVWPDPGAARDVVLDKLTRQIQPIILQAAGWQALHASAAISPQGIVVMPGVSGSGKSTLAYALGRMGWRQIADDALVWRRLEGDSVVGYALPYTRRLRPGADIALGREPAFPESAPRSDEGHPFAAFVFLRQDEAMDAPRVDPLSKRDAFHALLPHAHCFDLQDVQAVRRMSVDYMALADAVPAYRLTYRPHFPRLGDLAATVIDLAAACQPRGGRAPAQP